MSEVTFLRARLDEDESAAKATAPSGQRLAWRSAPEVNDEGTPIDWIVSDPNPAAVAEAMGLERMTAPAVATHIARHDPARVLREVEAKRAIIDRYEDALARGNDLTYSGASEYIQQQEYENWILPALTAVYRDHPNYDPSWSQA